MNKKLVAIAVAAAFTAPLAAQAETTVFGKVHLSVGTIEDTPAGTTTADVDNFQVNSHASRLGFKGSHDLGGGMKANYHLEWEVNPDSDNKSDTNDGTAGLKRRNQWAGIGGGWGEVRVGRHDTPLKIAQGKFDQFNDTNADIKGALSISQGENRLDNVIAYIGKFGDLTIAAAAVAGEGDGKTTASGGSGTGDGIADTTSIALMYGAGPLFVSVANDAYDNTDNQKNDSLTRAVATYKMGTMQLGLLYETGGNGGDDADKDIMGASFAMGVGGSNKVKLQYMTAEDSQSGTAQVEETQTSVGFDHKFNKQTTGYVMYTDGEDGNGTQSKREFTEIALGMIVNF